MIYSDDINNAVEALTHAIQTAVAVHAQEQVDHFEDHVEDYLARIEVRDGLEAANAEREKFVQGRLARI